MNSDEARDAIRKFLRENFKSDDIEHLVDPQMNIILKKCKWAWNDEVAKHYIEVDLPNLFRELGA